METQDVLDRLKQATTDRVQTTPSSRSDLATGRGTAARVCHNCGRDSLEAVVDRRALVPKESVDDGNQVALCEDCHQHVPRADPDADGAITTDGVDTAGQNHTVAARSSSYRVCATTATTVDPSVVRERDDYRCRGCGVRERIVVGDDLHLHPVVPLDTAGHRHPHNFVSLCPTCHHSVHHD